MDYLNGKVVYVNSALRIAGSGDADDFCYSFKGFINQNNNYDYVTLLSFTCTKSYYLIDGTNDTFTITESDGIKTITLAHGNYSFSSMVTYLNLILKPPLTAYTYTSSANLPTAKINFSVVGNAGFQPIFTFGSKSPYRILGFDVDSYSFVASLLTCPNVVNFQRTNSIELYSDMVENSLLASIVPDTPDNSVILYSAQSPPHTAVKMCRRITDTCRFYILDDSGQNLELNNIPLAFTLLFFKRNDYFTMQIREIHKKNLLEELQLRDDEQKTAKQKE